MDVLAETLDRKLHTWRPETAQRIREQIEEIIELADADVVDLAASRDRQQEVLDLLDSTEARRGLAS